MTAREAVVRLLTFSFDADAAHRIVNQQLGHLSDDQLRAAAEAFAATLRVTANSDDLLAAVEQVLRDIDETPSN
jgi:hypothetical protein